MGPLAENCQADVRPVRFCCRKTIESVPLKCYAINITEDRPEIFSGRELDAIEDHITKLRLCYGALDIHAGFAIFHKTMGGFITLGLWHSGVELLMIVLAEQDGKWHTHLRCNTCIWDAAVLAHEATAWMRCLREHREVAMYLFDIYREVTI